MESLLNPLKNIRKPSGSRERDRRLREGEYALISDALEATANPCARQAFDLVIETSLRQGMRVQLRWELGRSRATDHRHPCRVPAARQQGRAAGAAAVAVCRRSAEVDSGPADRAGPGHDGQRVALCLEAGAEGPGHPGPPVARPASRGGVAQHAATGRRKHQGGAVIVGQGVEDRQRIP